MLNTFSFLILNLDYFVYLYRDLSLKTIVNTARAELQLWCAAKSIINACLERFTMCLF